MSTTIFDGAWELTPADRLLVEAKRWGSRLRFAVMLLFYRARGRFPHATEVDRHAAAELARALGVPAPDSAAALLPDDSDDRTLKRQRAEIRALLGFREATVADAEDVGAWLCDTVAPRTRDMGELTAEAEARCRALRIEPPSSDRVARVVRAAVQAARIEQPGVSPEDAARREQAAVAKAWAQGRRNPAIAAEIDRFEQVVEQRLGSDSVFAAMRSATEGTPFTPPGIQPEHRQALEQLAQHVSAARSGRIDHQQQLNQEAWERTLQERQHERGRGWGLEM